MLSKGIFAQEEAKLSLVKYTQADGLPSYNVRKISKDKWGFLWIATQDGLARFDGTAFSSYTKQSSPSKQLSGPDVRQMTEDSARNLLWVLPNRSGIDVINTKTGTVINTIPVWEADDEDWNISMESCNNRLWIGSFSGLKIFDKQKAKFVAAPQPDIAYKRHALDFEVDCLIKDRFNNIWACYNGYGIVIYNSHTLEKIKEIRLSSLPGNTHNNTLQVNDYILDKNTVLLGTSQGLRRISYDKNYLLAIDVNPCSSIPALNSSPVAAIEEVGPNRVIISGNSNLYGFNTALDKAITYDESIAPTESKWIGSVQTLYHDGDILWLGCQQGIARMSLTRHPFIKYFFDRTTGNKLEHLRSLYVYSDGNILCGLSSGLMHIRKQDGRFTVLDQLHLYHHIFSDRENEIFLCRDDGIFLLAGNAQRPVADKYPEFGPYRLNPVNSHLSLGDTAILLGTENDNGVLLWNYKKHTVAAVNSTSELSLGFNTVNNLYKAKDGKVWVLSDKLITVFNKDMSHPQTFGLIATGRKIDADLFFDMCEANGDYWIASYGNGILQLDSSRQVKKIINAKEGLSNEGIYNIYSSGDSELIVTTNNGLSVFNTNSHTFKNYYKKDGLHSDAFEEVTSVCYNNKIYAGGINGFTVIDPSGFVINHTPPVLYYTGVAVQTKDSSQNFDTSNLEMRMVRIPAGWLQANIWFTGISYINPDGVSYQYRIKENDTTWIHIGRQHFITLVGLSHGTYHIEVKAINEDGYASLPKQLTITILPKWFETILFKIIAGLLISGLLYSFYRYRIYQLKQQQQIRRDIAGDLHDDIGSTLNSIKIYAHMAEAAEDKQSYFTQINESLKQATHGLRDMIWVLDDKQDSLGQLLSRLQQYTLPLANATNINILISADGLHFYPLTKTQKRNLLLIAKEAINNCIKYAACSRIDIVFAKTDNRISLIISDNGRGFNENEVIRGNGLNNITARAAQIKLTACIYSQSGKGTRIVISAKKQNA